MAMVIVITDIHIQIKSNFLGQDFNLAPKNLSSYLCLIKN